MNVRTRRALAVVLLSSAFVSACGLKPEVKETLTQGGGRVAGGAGVASGDLGGDTSLTDLGTGEVPLDANGVPLDTGAVGGDTGVVGGDPAAGGGDPAAGGGDPAAGGGAPAPGGTTTTTAEGGGGGGGAAAPAPAADEKGTTTGIDMQRKIINIALHGPLTGAGVPQESFRSGTPKYWVGRKLANGFTVNAEAVDDKYNAPDAARACAAAADKFFLIVGGAGTDQIQACGQQPKVVRGNVPYLSAGVTEAGLGNLKNYFATSLTYRQQGPLVVQMAKDKGFFQGQWAVVATEGPNFQDAVDGITGALKQAGAPVKVIRTPKVPPNCTEFARQIKQEPRPSTIYFLGQPSFFAQCVQAIGEPTYQPTYTGVGPSFGVNSIGQLACAGSANQYKGFFLHPATGLDQAGARAPGVTFRDDIEYQIYGAMQGLEKAFNQVQGNLTREKFIATLAKSEIPAGISPAAVYRGGSRFGGTKAFALQMDCTARQHKTVGEYGK